MRIILSEDDIDTVQRMLAQTNKLLGLLELPHSHCLEISDKDYKEFYNGLLSLKKGCEITLHIQTERKEDARKTAGS